MGGGHPDGATKENALAAKGLEYCSQLFEVEQKLEKMSDRERLEQITKELDLTKYVIFTGMVAPEKVPEYYQLGDVFVCASNSETQGITYIEAMASGLPALCRKDDCLKQVITDGYNGFQYENYEYFRMHLDYILEQSNRELPLHFICSEKILNIKRYDQEHQTDFYATLECYIKNKFNAVQTAKELFIHRSTFLYRMDRLQTLFGLDLTERDSLLYVLLSMKMLELSKSMMLRE